MYQSETRQTGGRRPAKAQLAGDMTQGRNLAYGWGAPVSNRAEEGGKLETRLRAGPADQQPGRGEAEVRPTQSASCQVRQIGHFQKHLTCAAILLIKATETISVQFFRLPREMALAG